MRATVREKENKPKSENTDVVKVIALLKSDNKIWTYAELCRRLKKQPNQLRALIDTARCYCPIMTFEKKGYKYCKTIADKDKYTKHIENQIKHKYKHLKAVKKGMLKLF